MDARSAMYGEIIKESLLRHSSSGGITLDALIAELRDVPQDVIENTVEELKFGGMVEEEDGKLMMMSFF